ncbi:MAG TPA: 1,4-alpha-glucan branching protein domain-containing protein [Thermomicrobiales bacterium]|nr:1,4-alpha-glucan branching protein domain-containing protein [Thermomicrobiales bacterium]
MVATIGAFTFVLHSHLPYARGAGMWPHGEEWIHEAIAETYLPLLNALHDLAEEGTPYRLTIGITPILAEQLADPSIVDHFAAYAAERAAWAANDVDRFEAAGDAPMRDLARFYHHWYARALASFRDRFHSDLIGAFRTLQDAGLIEIATSAATHAYLPLLARDSSIHGQLQTGVRAYERRFGRAPSAIWLPECAYRPAVLEEDDGRTIRRPGLESFLAEERLRVFFAETHTVEGGTPVGKAAGEAIGPYGAVTRRYAITPLPADERQRHGTTFRPYWVGDAPGEVAVLARNNRTGQQVWSAEFGYPGDFWYREFHRKDGVSGMQYWRISGRGVDLGEKAPYEPARAAERVNDHVAHYVHLVEEALRAFHADSGQFGVISAAYDTELFGHWWFEGVDWLKGVLRGLAQSDVVELSTASQIIAEHQPDEVLALPESSWGAGGGDFTWRNIDTQWMWPPIHAAERRMETLVARFPDAAGERRDVLAQTARELLLLESSDWPFLVTTGQAKEYASERFSEHVERFNRLADIAERDGEITAEDRDYLAAIAERDNPFAAIDYRDFAARQGEPAVTPPVIEEA